MKILHKIFVLIFLLLLPYEHLFCATRSMQVRTKNDQIISLPYKHSYALLIGVSKYTNGWPNLETIPNEMNKLEKVLSKQGFHVERVINPNSDELFDSYENFVDKYGYNPNNRLLFVYSGHGFTTDHGKKGFLVPADAPNPTIDLMNFKRQAMNMGRLLTLSREIESKHVLFLFDSCFSGTIFKTKGLPKYPKYITKSLAKPVRQFITSGSANEEVPAISVFMPMLRDAIKGAADLNHDSYVTGSELGVYLMQNLPNFEAQTPQYGKIKDYELSQGDFVFFPHRETPNAPQKKQISKKYFSIDIITIPKNCAIIIYGDKEYNYYKGLMLPEGKYKLKITRDGFEDREETIILKQSLELTFELEKKKKRDVTKKMFFGF